MDVSNWNGNISDFNFLSIEEDKGRGVLQNEVPEAHFSMLMRKIGNPEKRNSLHSPCTWQLSALLCSQRTFNSIKNK